MPRVMTTNATVRCPHGGVGTSRAVGPRAARIAGGDVLLDGDQGTLTCTNVPPCGSYQLRSMGLTEVTAAGRKVMLVTDFVRGATGYPLTITESHPVHDRTVADPAEDDQPTVVVTPPAAPFSTVTFGSTGQPAVLPFTFTLAGAYPLRWLLFKAGRLDSTSDWTGPLTVPVTVTGAELVALGPGLHAFVVTAVNRRGRAAFAEGKVTVT
ncbi:hypothetical protein GCM10010168_27130 [Actinoplanes ianthinogenes]|uniref:Fibronectin type-III domain-containing protein n=1 Tax=Actinoplanes ianthinogenes TaxID=122358 RepID=A0ABM7LL20_9ACTN|nr:hypothetical protein [Actinoplanes ianthinogenes]BCJ39853.1 hypothetical protein Aiant_05100 [Actinoplanes ianthinogenes]GGR08592.1 hypothetical protein GCM10010168_27130 [Actinoplanes ianthinogenes]